jgi:uncharacterized protein
MRRILLAAWFALAGLLAVLPAPAHAEVPVPPLKARVTDLTGTLNAAQTSELEARIAAYEARRGSQMAVLLLPSTKPEEIEQYSIRVADAWKIGRKGVDDGLILIVAKDDRRLRIEVGYGLEGVIPDSVARRVIDERITPRFRAGDFYGGVRDGVDQLIRLAEGEKLPPPQARAERGQSSPDDNWMNYIFFAVVLAVIVGGALKAILGRFPGSLATGAGLGLIVWLMFGIGVAVLAAVIAFLLTFINSGTGSGGRWSSGGLGGGSWGGGSSGGWSGGGGGGFGGGGSSGSW